MTDLTGLVEVTRRRWQATDTLLPAPALDDEGDLLVVDDGGKLVAAGMASVRFAAAGTLEETWFAPETRRLSALAADPPAFDRLLRLWRERLDGGSEAAIDWPSRDTEFVGVLLDHGLQPRTVTAVRRRGRPTPLAPAPPDLRIRPATAFDVEAVVALRLAEIRYDEQFGTIAERPRSAELLRELTVLTLRQPRPWVWIAERGTRPVGLAFVSPPERAEWAMSMVTSGPVVYIDCMSIADTERDTGVGTALARYVHEEADRAGAELTVLHHSQVNPLSTPFWSRMGYRPLWTQWATRPATAMT